VRHFPIQRHAIDTTILYPGCLDGFLIQIGRLASRKSSVSAWAAMQRPWPKRKRGQSSGRRALVGFPGEGRLTSELDKKERETLLKDGQAVAVTIKGQP
jgi:hypothetical protein